MKKLFISISLLIWIVSCGQNKVPNFKQSKLQWMESYSKLQTRLISCQKQAIDYALTIRDLKSLIRVIEMQNEERERYYTALIKQSDSLKTELKKLKQTK